MECTLRDYKALWEISICFPPVLSHICNASKTPNDVQGKIEKWKRVLKLSSAVSNDDCSKLAMNNGQGVAGSGVQWATGGAKICRMYAGAVCAICVCQNSKCESLQCQR